MKEIRYVLLDPTGNLTALVLDPVEPQERPRVTEALMKQSEQVGYLTEPKGSEARARLEMMGGEFCGNALRCLVRWWADSRPGLPMPLAAEISGCDHPLAVWAAEDRVRAELPLPEYLSQWEGLPVAVFPGIVHALYRGDPPTRAEAARITAGLCERFGAPAAGVLALAEDSRAMVPAVYVRDTDTMTFESSCASGSAAAAALLSREAPDGDWVYPLAQPGGVILASARREAGRLAALAISGEVALEAPLRVRLAEDELT